MLNVHYTPGDGKGWALDEDLRLIRSSLDGMVRETGAGAADVIHAPFWQNLSMVAPPLLGRAFVISHADNPPFFYLKQPEFAIGQTQVDLWIARSREAFDQFTRLHLPVDHIPYAIDPELFFPIPDKARLRREFGIPEDAYVIANFHRDSEGADLNTPKTQKAPEFLVAILKRLRNAGAEFHVLLAGPRRHWLRNELRCENIPFTFVGKSDVEADDFGINILDRDQLNKLYNASDLYLIPSRWEGGPQSAMEAAACRCKILSTPLGVARDILETESLIRTAPEAAARLLADIRSRSLDATVTPQFDRWHASHTAASLKTSLRRLYSSLEQRADFQMKTRLPRRAVFLSTGQQALHALRRRLVRRQFPQRVFWNHSAGHCPELDGILACVRRILAGRGVKISADSSEPIEVAGFRNSKQSLAKKIFQFTVPGFFPEGLPANALLLAPSVQDIINLRARGIHQPAVVLPFPKAATPQGEGVYVVESGDVQASLRVWAALQSGRPVIYPDDLAYYEQVFHAGIGFGTKCDQATALALAGSNIQELASLLRIPTDPEIARMLDNLFLIHGEFAL